MHERGPAISSSSFYHSRVLKELRLSIRKSFSLRKTSSASFSKSQSFAAPPFLSPAVSPHTEALTFKNGPCLENPWHALQLSVTTAVASFRCRSKPPLQAPPCHQLPLSSPLALLSSEASSSSSRASCHCGLWHSSDICSTSKWRPEKQVSCHLAFTPTLFNSRATRRPRIRVATCGSPALLLTFLADSRHTRVWAS